MMTYRECVGTICSHLPRYEHKGGEGGRRVRRVSGKLSAWAAGGLAVLVAAEPAAGQAGAVQGELKPGRDAPVPMRDAGDPMLVYLPSNYTAEVKWPVMFWYHGLEGGPTTEFVKRHTGGRDFVIVGMAYAGQDTARTDKELQAYLSKERATFQWARLWVQQHASVDPARCYLGGISRGGWQANRLYDLESRTLAGAAILLAGRLRSNIPIQPDQFKGKPVYIGVGDKDPNLLPSLQAREFYRHYGAVVTYDEYPGAGHAEPAGVVPIFASWLQMQGPCRRGVPAEERARMETRFRARFKEIMSGDDAVAKYERLATLAEDPALMAFRGTALTTEIGTQLAGMRGISPLKEEWAVEQAFYPLLWQSMNVRTLAEMKRVMDGLQDLGAKNAGTRYGKRAAELGLGVARAYQRSVEATERARRAK